jgi:hypothetical protein
MRPDIAESAGKAALHAEHEINQKKIDAAMASTHRDEPREASGLVLAGGETEPETGHIEQIAASDEAPPKPSWWQFWKSKPKSDAAQTDATDSDKTDSSQAVAASKSAKSDSEKNSHPSGTSASEKPKPGMAKLPASTASASHDADRELDSLSPESWFGKNFPVAPVSSSQAKPNPNDIFHQDPASEVTADLARAGTAAENDGNATSRPFPSLDPWQEDHSEANTLSTAHAAKGTASPGNESLAETPTTQPSAGTNSMESVVERHQRLRMKALLSEAHTNVIRGEFHAAYRAALLAEQVAEENHLTFTGNEENPRELARQIAAKIWRISNPAEQTYAAAAETLKQPSADQGLQDGKTSAATNDSRPGSLSSQSFATWTPVPSDGKTAAGPRGLASADDERLPEIRPSNSARDPWTEANPAWKKSAPATSVSQKTPTLPAVPQTLPGAQTPALTLGEPHPDQIASAGEGGVKFAIAQTVSTDEPALESTQFAPSLGEGSPFPPAFSQPSASGSLSSADSEDNRPKLMVPPARPIAQAAPRNVPSDWDQLSAEVEPSTETAKTRPAASSLRQRFVWGLLGLLATGVCTVIGVQVAGLDLSLRRRGGNTPPPEEPAEQRSLKIKRAA